MENRYTEGIAFDGAAILDNGKPITIDEILKRLNEYNELVNKTNDIHDVSKRKHQSTYDWGYINGYDDCNKGLPKRDDLGVYDD
jgi:hypothetical protein